MRRVGISAFAMSIVTVTLVSCGSNLEPPLTGVAQNACSPPTPTVTPSAVVGLVTPAQYPQIEDGMTLAQVAAIMGTPGAGQNDGYTRGTTNGVVWYDPTTKYTITVTFVDDAVTGKSAAGF
jgi:outer membrane protein assembly factor BamE (lipoprotein component of BamABCDE complex)